MALAEKGGRWVFGAEGAFEFTIGDEKKVARKGDSLLKQNGVIHGCVCLEKGIPAPPASDFINGHILYVDGGILAYIGKQP